MTGEAPVVCPTCKSPDSWRTIERMEGAVPADLCFNGDGILCVESTGAPQITSSEAVGIECMSCGWEHIGSDWREALTPQPDIAKMIATRERMRNKT